MSQIEKSLYKIFSDYSMQANSYQSTGLRTSKIHKILEDASVLDAFVRGKDVNTLISKVNGSNPSVTFPKFLQLVKEIAYYKYPHQGALEDLLNENLLPLARAISQKLCTINKSVLNLSNDILHISKNLHKSFKFLYTKHFSWELENRLSIDQVNCKSLKEMESLLKLCEIYPGLINKTKFHGIWREIVIMQDSKFQTYLSSALIPKTSSDMGRVLTLSKLKMVLYCCSVYGLQSDDSFTNKFVVLLEQMHLKLTKTYKSLRFIPSPEIMNQIKNHGNYCVETEYSDDPLSTDRSRDEDISRYTPRLQGKFQEYTLRDMKIAQFRKFVKDCGLLRNVLKTIDVDLIFTKHSRERKMSFQLFTDALLDISRRVDFEVLMNDYVLRTKNVPEENWGILNTREIKESIQILSQPFAGILKQYNCNSVLDFQAFQQFCVDFEIFPDFVSKNKLNSIYTHLIQLEETLAASSQEHTQGIHPLQFCKGLAFLSVGLFGKDHTLLEKLSMFVEVLVLSKGRKLAANGTTPRTSEQVLAALRNIRRRFPEQFQKSQGRIVTFQDFVNTPIEKEFY